MSAKISSDLYVEMASDIVNDISYATVLLKAVSFDKSGWVDCSGMIVDDRNTEKMMWSKWSIVFWSLVKTEL